MNDDDESIYFRRVPIDGLTAVEPNALIEFIDAMLESLAASEVHGETAREIALGCFLIGAVDATPSNIRRDIAANACKSRIANYLQLDLLDIEPYWVCCRWGMDGRLVPFANLKDEIKESLEWSPAQIRTYELYMRCALTRAELGPSFYADGQSEFGNWQRQHDGFIPNLVIKIVAIPVDDVH